MTTNQPRLPARVLASLAKHQDAAQWERFIVSMLEKLELHPAERAKAIKRYEELGRHVAHKLGVAEADAHVVVQGSMKTQTTTAMWGNTKFDLDIVIKLSSPKFSALTESEPFFKAFGKALEGIPGAGEPRAKNRCWRLQYPGETFYFDVTPAIPLSDAITGTDLRVRDPRKTWSPSNPEEFADWFCKAAEVRFPFQERERTRVIEAHTQVDPVPTAPVRIDDILRRTVQIIKLHRDNYYRGLSEVRQEGKPISVILVTLATHIYRDLLNNEANKFHSSIEVALAIVERLPSKIDTLSGRHYVMNPAMSGTRGENFADRWNDDNGLRHGEFFRWHAELEKDLEALFSEAYTKRDENRIQRVFGSHGVEAWKSGQDASGGLLGSLLKTVPAEPRSNPQTPVPTGSRNQLA